MANVRIAKGETLAKVRFSLKDPDTGTAVDLTGTTLQARFKISGGIEKLKALTIVAPATGGQAEFQPTDSTDFYAVGVARGSVEVTSGGRIGYSWTWTMEVYEPGVS